MSLLITILPLALVATAPEATPAPDATPAGTRRGSEPVAPVLDRAYALRVNRRARGVGIGFAQGLWGRGFGQRLTLDVPFGRRLGQFFGARVSGTFVHLQSPTADGGERWDGVAFGGLGVFGRSPVMGGVVRVFGSGGVFVGGRPAPTDAGAHFGIAGGGAMGIEAFAAPRVGFSVEVGGQGPVHGLRGDGGASVMGGVNVYFGR